MAKAGPVFLMSGAGPGSSRKSVRFHDAAVAATGKKKPRIAYLGCASGDSLAFEKTLGAMIFGLTADVVSVKLTKSKVKTSEAKQVLSDADLIFVSGGDVDEGMRIVNERDLAPYFRELSSAGKVMEGVSAGSIMLGQHWVRFPEDGDESRATVFDCLGVVPRSFDAHGEGDDWEELQVLARLLAGREREPVLGLVSGHCGLWDGTELRALGGPLHRFTCADAPERLDDLQPAPE